MGSSLKQFLRNLAVAAALTVGAYTFASAEPGVSALEIQGDGDIVRLQLETRVGVFANASLAPDGKSLNIDLAGAHHTELVDLIAQLKKLHPLIKSINLSPEGGKTTQIVVQLTKPVGVIDETLTAATNDRSRWELVLGGGTALRQATPPKPGVKPELGAIAAAALDDRLDITLTGSTGLVAEASFADKSGKRPARLIVDLPGVSGKELDAAIAAFKGDHPLLQKLRSAPAPAKNTGRLEFDLGSDAELVQSYGSISEGKGRIHMSLVADTAPTAPGAALIQGRLDGIELGERDGVLTLAMPGAIDARVQAYALEQPPRLVLDFLGWRPEQVQAAVSRFRPAHRAVLGASVDATQRGSARVVFSLAAPSPMLGKPERRAVAASQDRLVISLQIPQNLPERALAAARDGVIPPSALDFPYKQDSAGLGGPRVVIKPVQLDGVQSADGRAPVYEGGAGSEHGIMSFYQKALDYDAKYKAAQADYEANIEAVPQARAGYLPVATFDFQRSGIRQSVKQASNAAFPTGTSNYPSTTWTLTITQPILKAQAFIRMNQAGIAAEQAKLNLLAAEQDLILRVANAYLNLLATQDAVALAQAERESTQKQLELASSRLASGLGTVTQQHDVEARYALTEAREIEARNKHDDAKQALKEIVGEAVSGLKGFKGDFDAAAPQPATFDPWLDAAMQQNLALQVRSRAHEIASQEVRRQRAGHLPTLDLVGTVQNQDTGGSLYGQGQKTENMDIGLKLRVPLFEGGLTSSLVREAVARENKALQERDEELRRTERQTRAAFLGVQTSAKTLEALRKSVLAQESALQARIEGFRSGVYNLVAVLDANRLFYSARRDYLQARYDYLVNRLKLKQSVGSLSRGDLEDLSYLID